MPFLIATIVTLLSAGIVVSGFGYYHPFMIASTIITAIGAGLLTTLQASSRSGVWIGYQIMAGLGIGLGTQQPLIASQAVLQEADVPIGTGIICFFQILGPAVFVSVGQSVLTNRLAANLQSSIPGFNNTSALTDTGVLGVESLVGGASAELVVSAYNSALTQTLYISVALASLSVIGVIGMDWKKIETPKDGDT